MKLTDRRAETYTTETQPYSADNHMSTDTLTTSPTPSASLAQHYT
jgi:hypothetical protein